MKVEMVTEKVDYIKPVILDLGLAKLAYGDCDTYGEGDINDCRNGDGAAQTCYCGALATGQGTNCCSGTNPTSY